MIRTPQYTRGARNFSRSCFSRSISTTIIVKNMRYELGKLLFSSLGIYCRLHGARIHPRLAASAVQLIPTLILIATNSGLVGRNCVVISTAFYCLARSGRGKTLALRYGRTARAGRKSRPGKRRKSETPLELNASN